MDRSPLWGLLLFLQQVCKPGSVSWSSPMGSVPGSLSFIWSTYPPTSDEQPLAAGIHGLSAQKADDHRCHHWDQWALTSPSHPYHPLTNQGRAVIFFSASIPSRTSFSRKYGALCCPDFPLFVHRCREPKNDRMSCWIPAKVRNFQIIIGRFGTISLEL